MDNVRVFEVDVNLLGTDTLFKKLYFLGYHVFQIAHLANEYIYDEDSDFRSEFPVEVGSIKKIAGISNIANPEFILTMLEDEEHGHDDFDGSEPIEMAKQLPDEAVMEFSCECRERIRVPNSFWRYVTCPNCENKILRREITDAGGIFIYTKLDNNKK